MSTQSRLRTTNRQSNTGYHECGSPNWWARLGSGEDAQFLSIPKVRGDRVLDCVVNVPPGTLVICGAGRGKKSVRETVETGPVDAQEQEQA